MAIELISSGSDWIVSGGGFTPGYLLATQQYAPAVQAGIPLNKGTVTALDTTNLTLSLVVPPSGNVDIHAEFMAAVTVTIHDGVLWVGVLNHTGGALIGSCVVATLNEIVNTTSFFNCTPTLHLTGLNPGPLQVDLAAGIFNVAGSAGNIYIKSNASTAVTDTAGSPALIQATAA